MASSHTGDATGEKLTTDCMHALAASDVDVRNISGSEPGEKSGWTIEVDAPANFAAVGKLIVLADDHGFTLDTVDDNGTDRWSVTMLSTGATDD